MASPSRSMQRAGAKNFIADTKQAARRLMVSCAPTWTRDARTVGPPWSCGSGSAPRWGCSPNTIAQQSAAGAARPVFELRLNEVTRAQSPSPLYGADHPTEQRRPEGLRPATHRFDLSVVQCMKWAQNGATPAEPWAEVEPIGRVSANKPQRGPRRRGASPSWRSRSNRQAPARAAGRPAKRAELVARATSIGRR